MYDRFGFLIWKINIYIDHRNLIYFSSSCWWDELYNVDDGTCVYCVCVQVGFNSIWWGPRAFYKENIFTMFYIYVYIYISVCMYFFFFSPNRTHARGSIRKIPLSRSRRPFCKDARVVQVVVVFYIYIYACI